MLISLCVYERKFHYASMLIPLCVHANSVMQMSDKDIFYKAIFNQFCAKVAKSGTSYLFPLGTFFKLGNWMITFLNGKKKTFIKFKKKRALTHTHTDGHCNLENDLARWANSVKF